MSFHCGFYRLVNRLDIGTGSDIEDDFLHCAHSENDGKQPGGSTCNLLANNVFDVIELLVLYGIRYPTFVGRVEWYGKSQFDREFGVPDPLLGSGVISNNEW